MPTLDESFPTILAALEGRYGRPPSLAEGLTPFEVLVAVMLSRAVEARKVTAALGGLAESGLLEPRALAEAEPAEVVDALRAVGISVSSRSLGPLRHLARWVVEHDGGLTEPPRDPDQVREELLGLNGIGPATADALLLFAWRRPVYPVDRATYRILVRHGWLDPTAEYDEARAVVERQLPDDPSGLANLSAWLEQVGRAFCRAGAPRCEGCPLQPALPEGGPKQPD